MKFLSIIPASLVFFLGGFASPSYAQESRWGSPEEETVKFIIAAEAKWANSACSPQPDLKDVIADDFQGTSPSGRRYDKAKAIATDTKSLSHDCQLGEVKVRFFGDSIAIAYGAESAVSKGKDGKGDKALSDLDRHVAQTRREMADRGCAGHRHSLQALGCRASPWGDVTRSRLNI
jgi:hypothetical protein